LTAEKKDKVEKVEPEKAEQPKQAPEEVCLIREKEFINPYTYDFLLKRINGIIKVNNTYSSKLGLSSSKQGFSPEEDRDREGHSLQI
jgi:hypothetical protein